MAPQCSEPEGGWRPTDLSSTTEVSLREALQLGQTLDGYAGAWFYEGAQVDDPTDTVLNVRTTADIAVAEQALREMWGGALCVSHAERTYAELRRIQTELMDTGPALGAGAAYLYSLPGLLPHRRSHFLYFEAAASIVTFVLLGRYLEERAKGKAGEAIRQLIELQPATATLLRDGVELVVDRGPGDMAVRGNRQHLVSAVTNLIDNAVKYTAAGSLGAPLDPVVVTLQRDGAEIVVAVEDHGIGIAESHVPRIFERFYRVDRARSRETGGTGLGLSIVRNVARTHGGTVDVTSREGVGSTFTLRLPAGRL